VNIDVVVVPHSHWDREWYLPVEGYRPRLTQMLDGVLALLEGGSLPCFVLDGQCVVVEDYLERRPERRESIAALVRAGRLRVGPWYVLADEFLVSGEALIRNLSEGRRVAAGFGAASDVAYSPDPFGHVSQLPQIVRGFGMNAIVFARGLGDEPTRTLYRWEGADGSSVHAFLLATSYSNGRLLLADGDAAARIRAEVGRLLPFLEAPVALVCAGSDHEVPDSRLGHALAGAAERLTPWRVRCGTLEDYRDEVLRTLRGPTSTLRGELRGARLLPLLPGVLSARMPLKQANDRCQDALEGMAEPLSALAWLVGGEDPRESLRAAWRELLLNQAHDGICGCSVDAVHRENATRFERVEQTAQTVVEAAAWVLSAHATAAVEAAPGEHLRVFFNLLGQAAGGPCEVTIREPLQDAWRKRPARAGMAGGWRARGGDGRSRRVQVLDETVGEGVFPYPSDRLLRTTRLLVASHPPPLGYEALTLSRGRGATEGSVVRAARRGEIPWIENEALRVEVEAGGSLSVVHRASGRRWSGLARLESEADAGDTYNFGPLDEGATVVGFSAPPRCTVRERGPLRASLRVRGAMRVPLSLSRDRDRRSRRATTVAVVMDVSVTAGQDTVEVEVTVENRAQDHRLRLCFPVADGPLGTWAEGAFDVVRRAPAPPAGDGWIEDPATTHPHRGFCFVPQNVEATVGLALLARGLPEYELVRGSRPHLALTLLRCVGFLSREDVAARRCQAGPKIPVAQAQCPGAHRFRLALAPLVEEEPVTPARLLRLSRAFAVPLLCVDARAPVGWGQESWARPAGPFDPRLAGTAGLVEVDGEDAVLSAMHVADDAAWIIRLLGASDRAGEAVLRLHPALGEDWRVTLADLDGASNGGATLARGPRGWVVPLRPWGLATVRLERASPGLGGEPGGRHRRSGRQ